MGMDVFGRNPSSKEGEYFRNNVWRWHPLAHYCTDIAPDVTAQCKNWHSNDGDGLDERNSLLLADALQREIDSGRSKKWADIRQSELERLPNEQCDCCGGTGTRKPLPDEPPEWLMDEGPTYIDFTRLTERLGAGDPANGGIKCNVCDGTGYVRPLSCYYSISVENVQAFATFLRGCGGFQIC
jgi:hypothetical protein